jgi:hypothetical protein
MSHSTGLTIFFGTYHILILNWLFLEQGACQTGGDLTDGARQRLAAIPTYVRQGVVPGTGKKKSHLPWQILKGAWIGWQFLKDWWQILKSLCQICFSHLLLLQSKMSSAGIFSSCEPRFLPIRVNLMLLRPAPANELHTNHASPKQGQRPQFARPGREGVLQCNFRQ